MVNLLPPYSPFVWRIIGAIVVVLTVCLTIWVLSGGGRTRRENNMIGNVGEHEGENRVIGNLIQNKQREVNDASSNTNRAVNDLRNSVNRPSNSFDGNRAADRFCFDFPGDPSCPKL